jgi:hypothetical protein
MERLDAVELTHADRLNRLFAYYHARLEPELTEQAVATIVGQALSRRDEYPDYFQLDPKILVDVRQGRRDLPLDIADAICDQVGADRDYFRGSDKQVHAIDQTLRLWTIARDLGLNHLACRGMSPEHIDSLIDELSAALDPSLASVTAIR